MWYVTVNESIHNVEAFVSNDHAPESRRTHQHQETAIMISDTDRDKIAKLPVWVRELIKRLEYANEPMLNECGKLRRENTAAQERARRTSEALEALMELLKCAAKGGSDWAATIVSTLDNYEIYRTLEEQP